MNPNTNETAGMQLPPPVIEQSPSGTNNAESLSLVPEQGPAVAERAPAASAAPASGVASIPLPLPPMPMPPVPPIQNDNTSGAVQSKTASVDDRDLIEKEWVNKAKQIVEQTRDDPYKQSEELTVFKADYLQKNYGKNIKLSK